MKVILAASSQFLIDAGLDFVADAGVSGKADQTVEVDDATGSRLLAGGLARLPESKTKES